MCDEESEGSGGMASKLTVARDFALGGGTAYVFNGTDSSLSDFLERENPKALPGGTVIVP
jgi:isopentenyl phosphate kinase